MTADSFLWVTDTRAPVPDNGQEPWGPGQPSGAAQDCVRIQGSSGDETLYDDGECTASYAYACECDGRANDPARYTL